MINAKLVLAFSVVDCWHISFPGCPHFKLYQACNTVFNTKVLHDKEYNNIHFLLYMVPSYTHRPGRASCDV